MPKLGGLETYELLKETDPAVKTVLSTGYNHSGKVREILDKGVLDFIKKPYRIQELLTHVRRVLDG